MSVFDDLKSKADRAAVSISESSAGARLGISKSAAMMMLVVGGTVAVGGGGYIFFGEPSLSCSSSDAQDLVIDTAKTKSNILMLLGLQYRKSELGETVFSAGSINKDPEFERLQSKKTLIESNMQKAVNFCFDDTKHPEEFRFDGANRAELCNPTLGKAPDLNSMIEECDTACIERGLQEQVNINNRGYRYYFDFASKNIYPLLEEISSIDAEIAAYKEAASIKMEQKREENKKIWQDASADVEWNLSNIITEYKQENTGSVACKATISAAINNLSQNRNITYTIQKTSEGKLYTQVWGL